MWNEYDGLYNVLWWVFVDLMGYKLLYKFFFLLMIVCMGFAAAPFSMLISTVVADI